MSGVAVCRNCVSATSEITFRKQSADSLSKYAKKVNDEYVKIGGMRTRQGCKDAKHSRVSLGPSLRQQRCWYHELNEFDYIETWFDLCWIRLETILAIANAFRVQT